MENLEKFSRKYGDIENGFYTVKTVVRNPKGELFVNYVQYIDDKKVSLTKHIAWIDGYGDIETIEEPCYRKFYSTNH